MTFIVLQLLISQAQGFRHSGFHIYMVRQRWRRWWQPRSPLERGDGTTTGEHGTQPTAGRTPALEETEASISKFSASYIPLIYPHKHPKPVVVGEEVTNLQWTALGMGKEPTRLASEPAPSLHWSSSPWESGTFLSIFCVQGVMLARRLGSVRSILLSRIY